MRFDDWLLCDELIRRMGAIPDESPFTRKERRMLAAIDYALKRIGTRWRDFDRTFREVWKEIR
jgi:hypothetical protein